MPALVNPLKISMLPSMFDIAYTYALCRQQWWQCQFFEYRLSER